MVVLDFVLGDKVIILYVFINNLLIDGFYLIYFDCDWFINFGGMKISMLMGWIFVVIIFVIFVGILLFMEIEMMGVFLSKKEYKF